MIVYVEKIKFLREAAAVKRCHTTPIHGEYQVGYHSFNMLTVLRILWPDAPVELLWAIIEHDMPERWTGDLPHPAKRADWFNNALYADDEAAIIEFIIGYSNFNNLNDELMTWLKGLDLLEFFMFGKDQQMMGNRNLNGVMRSIMKYVDLNKNYFPGKIIDMFYEVQVSDWEWLPDYGGGI